MKGREKIVGGKCYNEDPWHTKVRREILIDFLVLKKRMKGHA
jgi:hypothetical protein